LNELEDEPFRCRFRLSKALVEDLLTFLMDDLSYASQRNAAISPMGQLLVTLRFYACASFQVQGKT
jgi:hypothetical protein